ncbi:hypothetical protein FACS1894140_6450 [Spirochaetia bacterium]|nr:hypothetical protein FACS1894140_6450 [Spirochaetia bacterium]
MIETDALKPVFENPEKFGCIPLGPSVLDGGIDVPGGWQAGKRLVLSLLSGFADVVFDQIQAGGRMVPTLDVYLDRTVAAAEALVPDDQGVVSAAGYGFCHSADRVYSYGDLKLVAAGPSSLLAHLYAAGMVLPQTVQGLLSAGFCREEIFWGFSSVPIILRQQGEGEIPLQEQVHKAGRLVSIWVRGADEEITSYLKGWHGPGELRLHNLRSGNTFVGGKIDEEGLARCLLDHA